ncbi:uncharacterized protein LOC128238211 [Mya arenaria]|uniref:uncharacterized protein LOC128238211 n=1 Tax=Mya arenaria TaxID=6604 RepID=UPI0022E0AEB8|nr:uncharacterized protein LOC128238211 [Mya arenaria]XP_052809830.1 uncharacterized protein LOC128238211 [Mya arenaria]
MRDNTCFITCLPDGTSLPEVVEYWMEKTSSSFILIAKFHELVINFNPQQNTIDRIKDIPGSKRCKNLAEIHSKEDENVMVIRENGENHVQVHEESSEINSIIEKIKKQAIMRKCFLNWELKKDCNECTSHQKQTQPNCNDLCYNNIECADCISAEEDHRIGNTIYLPTVINSRKYRRHSLEEVRDEERDPILLGIGFDDNGFSISLSDCKNKNRNDENHDAEKNLNNDVLLDKSKLNATKLHLDLLEICYWNGLIGMIRERTTLPEMLFFHIDIVAYPSRRRVRRRSQQQAEEHPRYHAQCTEESKVQDRESRNYDIVTSTSPVFSDRDSATATNTPLPVTPTLNIPYAQERARQDMVQGQGQHSIAGGGRTNPRHPQYQDQTARQRSFTNWPATAHQAPARMVEFGFFYTGHDVDIHWPPPPQLIADCDHAEAIRENQRLKRILKCIQCKRNDCNLLFLPCSHHRLCVPCAENITNCLVCGREVEEKVKTYR